MFQFFIFSATLLLPTPATTLLRIRQVQVEGNERIPTLSIVREIASKPDAAFDAARLEVDLKIIHHLGFFSQVDAETKSVSDRQVARVSVRLEF